MGITNLYKNFFGDKYGGLANFYNTYVKHSNSVGGDGGLGGLACRVIWCLNFTSYEYTPSNLTNGNANNAAKNNNGVYLDNVSKVNRWITESNMFKHMEGLCCKVDMPNFSIIQQVDNTKGKVTVDNREGVYQTVGGSPIWGDKDTVKLTFYETQIPLIENYIWPWLKTCKYSFIATRDVFSIPRANMHVLIYPDDAQTNVAFKYIVYGMYPVSFDSFQPSHEKKTAIDRRGVTFAYNNITVEQDTTFVNGITDNWGKQPAGNPFAISKNGVAGQMGSELSPSGDEGDTTKKIKPTKITNTAENPDKKKELKKNIFNAIKLNGTLDGSNPGNFNTPDLLNNSDINGDVVNKESELFNNKNGNGDNTDVNGNENGNRFNELNGGNNKPIDTTEFIKPPALQLTDNYLKNFGTTVKTNLINGGDLTEQIAKMDGVNSNLNGDSNNGNNSSSYLKGVGDNSKIHNMSLNNGDNNVDGGNNGNISSANRINQLLGILNKLDQQNNSHNGGGSNIPATADLSNIDSQIHAADYSNNNVLLEGLDKTSDVNTRTYSVVKQKSDIESGFGGSNEKSLSDLFISDEIQKQIERRSVQSENKTNGDDLHKENFVVAAIQSQQNNDSYVKNLSQISSDVNQKIISKDVVMSIDDALKQINVDQKDTFGEAFGDDEQMKNKQSGYNEIKSTQLTNDVDNKVYVQTVERDEKRDIGIRKKDENVSDQINVVVTNKINLLNDAETIQTNKSKNVALEVLKRASASENNKRSGVVATNNSDVNQVVSVISKQSKIDGPAISNTIDTEITKTVKTFDSSKITNDDTDQKMANIDKSISLDEAISMFEEQQTDNNN